MLQRVVRIVPAGGEDELVQRLEVDVHVAVLEHLVVEVVLGEFGVQGEQGTVFLGGVRELRGAGGVLRAVLRDFPPAGLVVLPRGAVHAQLQLRIGPVHIGLGEVRIQLDGLVVVREGVVPAAHLQEEAGPVEVGQHVVRVDVDDAVHVRQGRREIAHLGRYEAAVVQGEGVAGLVPEDGVEVRHRLVQVALLGVQDRAVEIGQGVGGVQFDGLVHVLDGGVVVGRS